MNAVYRCALVAIQFGCSPILRSSSQDQITIAEPTITNDAAPCSFRAIKPRNKTNRLYIVKFAISMLFPIIRALEIEGLERLMVRVVGRSVGRSVCCRLIKFELQMCNILNINE